MILDYPGGLKVITRYLEVEKGRRESQSGLTQLTITDFGMKEAMRQQRGQLLEVGKGKKRNSLLELLQRMHRCQYLAQCDVSPTSGLQTIINLYCFKSLSLC